ncbi:MAG: YceI family protein [Candidatus Omnitrophica bacterium]|nr:YceI family protein [Candidatus Omnitrophota bacterium]
MKKLFLLCVALLVAVAASSAVFAADLYQVDAAHSSIGFAVKHMMVARVNGVFGDFQGDIKFDPADLPGSKFDFVIKVASIDTRNSGRDAHLKGADFFNAEKFPDIVFKTKAVARTGEGVYAVTGDLTMKDVTKEVVIPVTVDGPVFNPMAKADGIGIEAVFKVNRQDYGVNWNKDLDNGGVVVGNDVAVNVNIEAHKSR